MARTCTQRTYPVILYDKCMARTRDTVTCARTQNTMDLGGGPKKFASNFVDWGTNHETDGGPKKEEGREVARAGARSESRAVEKTVDRVRK